MKNWLAALLTIFVYSSHGQLKCGKDIDLNTWIHEGNPTDGNWSVSPDGKSVEQSINGEPTFFVSPDTFINVIMEGKIKVNTANDDDLVGFVFGYKNPSGPVSPTAMNIQTYVFDWKQSEQTDGGGTCLEGYALYKVDGVVDYTDYAGSTGPIFWARDDTPISTMLANNYADNGWNDFQEYTFRLRYTAWNITIWIDGEEIINYDGCNEPGRFGFYNSSQNYVIYSDFTYQYIADFDVINPDICINDTGRFTIGWEDCPYSDYYPFGTSFVWDFGDGEIGKGRSQKHKYSEIGDYDVALYVTDPLGCIDTSMHTIKVDWAYLGAVDSLALCNGESTVIDVGIPNGLNYDWNTGDFGPEITVVDPGIYIAQIEDSAGCIGFDTTIIDFEANPIVDIGEDTSLCVGDTIGLKVNDPKHFYEWSNGSKEFETTVLLPGEYWVVARTPLGCEGRDTIVLEVANPIVGLPPDTILCESSAPISIEATLQQADEIYWSTGDTGKEIEVGSSREVSIEIKTLTGCIARDTMKIIFEAAPLIELPEDTGLCLNEGPLFIKANVTGEETLVWNTGETSKVIEVNKTSQLIIEAKSEAGCSNSDTIEVLFYDVPTVQLPGDIKRCLSEGPAVVEPVITNADEILWSTGETGPIIEVDTTQNLWVKVKSKGGCLAGDDMEVYLEETPTVVLPPDTSLCEGDYLSIPNVGLVDGFSWSGPEFKLNGKTIEFLSSGTYLLEATSPLGCSSKDSLFVLYHPLQELNIGRDTTVCFNDFPEWKIGIEGLNGDYMWSTGETSEIITINSPGKYGLSFTTPYGCISTDDYLVNEFCPHAIYFPNAFTPNNDGKNDRFPTPNYNLMDYRLMIFNRWGQKIFESKSVYDTWDGTFNGAECQIDVYVWKAIWKYENQDGEIDSESRVGHVSLIK